MKKLLSVVLALLMLAVMLPVTAMAEEGDPTCVNGVWQNVTPPMCRMSLMADTAPSIIPPLYLLPVPTAS